MSRYLQYSLLILAFVGLAISLFLTYEYNQVGPISCGLSSNTCETVRNSEYSVLFGVSLPYYGDVYFLGLIIFLMVPMIFEFEVGEIYKGLLFMGLLSGFIFETYFTYIEVFIIGSICLWCAIIEILITVMFLVYLISEYITRLNSFKDSEI